MDTKEYTNEDLDVTTKDGLAAFSTYIHEVYEELTTQETLQASAILTQAKAVYNDLQVLIGHCQDLVEAGTTPTSKDVEALQMGYNRLLDFLDEESDEILASVDVEPDLDEIPLSSILTRSTLKVTDVDAAPPVPAIAHSTVPMVKMEQPKPMVVPRIHHAPLEAREVETVKRVMSGPFSEIIDILCHIPRYRTFIEDEYSSLGHLELLLKREVEKIEERPLRGFYKVFGFQFQNAFHTLLRDMTIPEAVAFDDQPRALIRQKLKEVDIKYEVYVEWIDSLVIMLERTHAHKDMTVGELFVRNFLEEKIAQKNARENTTS